METINKMTAAAANVVWGTGSEKATDPKTAPTIKQEPLSGVTGDTAKGEPYDAGNITPAPVSADITFLTPTTHDGEQVQKEGNKLDEAGIEKTASGNDIDTPKTGIEDSTTQMQKLQLGQEESQPVHDEHMPRSAGPSSNQRDGEGERNTGSDVASSQPISEVVGSVEQKSHPEEQSTESQGTGKEYVQSTGLQADGGDFDVTKSGAGMEADRLLEEKKSGGSEESQNSHDPDTKGKAKTHSSKRSLGERIKAKFHKDKH